MEDQGTAFNANYSEGMNFALLTWHCFKKGVQLGSVIGTVVVPPLYYFRTRKTIEGFQFSQLLRYQLVSMCIGSVLSLGMMLAKYNGWQNKGACLRDRVYRIQKNVGQVRTDLFAGAGFISSVCVGYLWTGNVGKSLGLSSLGIVAGILAHVGTKTENKE